MKQQGSTWLRWILCEAAQTAKRHPDFAASYAAIARRRGKKIATTAVARKLLTRAFHLLTDADAPSRHRVQKTAGTPTTASTTTNITSTTSGIRRTRARAGTAPNSG